MGGCCARTSLGIQAQAEIKVLQTQRKTALQARHIVGSVRSVGRDSLSPVHLIDANRRQKY
jgi:hypothetical protein